MKKMVIISGSIILVAGAFIAYFTGAPDKAIMNRELPGALNAAYRGMVSNDGKNMEKWAGGEFKLSRQLLNSAEIQTKDGQKGLILLVFKSANTTAAHLEINARGKNFFAYRKLKQSMKTAMDSLSAFVADTKNVYGMKLEEGTTTDTNLLATRFVDSSYPSSEKIYAFVGQLRKYAHDNSAKEISYPMINITPEYNGNYKCMVALPVDRKITTPENSPIFFTRMVPAKFLIGEVKGGTASVKNAHKMLEEYLEDYQRTAMAIPFDYLITDRLAEKDTTKWITRIYTPVF